MEQVDRATVDSAVHDSVTTTELSEGTLSLRMTQSLSNNRKKDSEARFEIHV